jgi:tripartite-type tricarboxylate transporter receptor subunit TctC
MASAKIPADVLEKIRADAIRAMHAPDLRKRILDAGSVPVGNSAEEFRQVIKDDLQTFGEIVAKMK